MIIFTFIYIKTKKVTYIFSQQFSKYIYNCYSNLLISNTGVYLLFPIQINLALLIDKIGRPSFSPKQAYFKSIEVLLKHTTPLYFPGNFSCTVTKQQQSFLTPCSKFPFPLLEILYKKFICKVKPCYML